MKRNIIYIIVVLLAFALGYVVSCDVQQQNAEKEVTKVVTQMRIDTITRYAVTPLYTYYQRDTIRVKDSIRDTIYVRASKVYEDSTYRAVVSGYDAHLDSIEVYRPTITRTITNTITRVPHLTVALHSGIAYTARGFSPCISLGISYNLFALKK